MAKADRLSRVLTLGVYVLGAVGVVALAVGVLLEIGVLFLGGVGAVVGALVGHNTLDAHARRKLFEPGERDGPWG
jgi:hypothetical protein